MLYLSIGSILLSFYLIFFYSSATKPKKDKRMMRVIVLYPMILDKL